jgi:hypothetical protein
MYRCLLTSWLVICSIGYGSAWAYDGHFDPFSQHGGMPGAMSLAEDGGDHLSCDHCCHASAHLIGMWANQPVFSLPDASTVWPHYRTMHYSILGSPPGRPPRA